jgi:CheY-like chemotaxis protein
MITDLEIKSILLLDDDLVLADTLRDLLESRNFLVTVVSNGAEGLKQVLETDFDVVMCDIMMPSMAGDMFYLAVQKIKPHLCERFVFMTGFSGDPNVTKFLTSVNALVLEKPAKLEDIIRMISLVLHRNARSRAYSD